MKGRSLLALMVLLLAVSPAWAQIAFDTTSNSTPQLATTSYSWSHTCNGSDRVLIVGLSMFGAGNTATAVTYNSVNMTKVVRHEHSPAFVAEQWRLIAPDTGANTIAVTLTSSSDSFGGATSWTGVDQTTPVEASAGNGGGLNTTVTVSVTTITANAWVVDSGSSNLVSATFTVGAGQTERWNALSGIWAGGSTEGPVVTPASTTMSWTISGASKNWATTALVLKPAAAAARRLMVIQ